MAEAATKEWDLEADVICRDCDSADPDAKRLLGK